jgi:hypothetical protein
MRPEQLDFDRLTAGLTTKSEKMRALARSGARTADIARYLGVRYQHARNVLKEAGLHKVAQAGASSEAVESRRPYAWVELGADGNLTIPAELLTAVGLRPGLVHIRPTADGLELFSRQAALARLQAIAAPFKRPGVSEVDDFIAERHREAERE